MGANDHESVMVRILHVYVYARQKEQARQRNHNI